MNSSSWPMEMGLCSPSPGGWSRSGRESFVVDDDASFSSSSAVSRGKTESSPPGWRRRWSVDERPSSICERLFASSLDSSSPFDRFCFAPPSSSSSFFSPVRRSDSSLTSSREGVKNFSPGVEASGVAYHGGELVSVEISGFDALRIWGWKRDVQLRSFVVVSCC